MSTSTFPSCFEITEESVKIIGQPNSVVEIFNLIFNKKDLYLVNEKVIQFINNNRISKNEKAVIEFVEELTKNIHIIHPSIAQSTFLLTADIDSCKANIEKIKDFLKP